jgi:hypothetical protein
LSQASDINSSSYQNIDQNAPENYAQNDNLDSFRSGNEGSGMEDVSSHSSIALPTPPVMLRNPDTIFDDQSSPESRLHQDDQITRADNHVIDQGDLTESDYQTPISRGSLGDVTSNVQESCLLLYFIEELSPWVF